MSTSATLAFQGRQTSTKLAFSGALLAAAMVTVYAASLRGLFNEWWNNPDYSHGLLIPFIVGYLIYEKRSAWSKLPVSGHWMGGILILGSQVMELAGFVGAEYFLQRVSFVVLLGGLALFFLGTEWLKEICFMLLIVLLAIPLPALIFNSVALPLQLLASRFSEATLMGIGIPIYREGNILELPNLTLSVAEACSGIRSLMSLITLAVVLSHFFRGRWWLRATFIVSAIPIAIMANVIRVAGTGILGRFYGAKASSGFFHGFSGWVIFVMAFAILTMELQMLVRLEKKAWH